MNTTAIRLEWNRCRDWLLPALSDATEDEVMNELFLGRAQLWGGARCALVTRLVSGDEPAVVVWLAGGDRFEMLAAQPFLESWSRQQGAVAAYAFGRKGWSRFMKPTGFEAVGNDIRKAL